MKDPLFSIMLEYRLTHTHTHTATARPSAPPRPAKLLLDVPSMLHAANPYPAKYIHPMRVRSIRKKAEQEHLQVGV
jgi:hypothetical protein